jgi:CDP-glucose 4,6-dehydratase
VINPGFWRGRRVFLTGHTGFKGSWLALWLQRMGADVTGFALAPPSHPSLFERARIQQDMHHHTGDVRDAAAVRAAVSAAAPEVVLHLAAQSLVRYSYAHPVETYATNVMGTVHVLDAVRACPSTRVALVVTSDKCYRNQGGSVAFDEDAAMGGHDPYSSSKGCAELVTDAYTKSYFSSGTAVASARAGNVIGGGDWAEDRLVPDVVRALEARTAVRLRNPAAVRPWQHVLEPLAGYLRLAEHLWEHGQVYAGGWNFGPAESDAAPVGQVVRALAAHLGGPEVAEDTDRHPYEAQVLRLDCAKARDRLGWVPRLPLERGLAWTAEWYRTHLAGEDARLLTERQIDDYMRLLAS